MGTSLTPPKLTSAHTLFFTSWLLSRQIGLGGNVTLDTITVPTEVVLWRGVPSNTRTQCIDLNAGGELAFFTVERVDGTAIRNVEILSCGNGQYGGLGNALFSNAQSVPVRTKAISGLLECTFFFLLNRAQPVKTDLIGT